MIIRVVHSRSHHWSGTGILSGELPVGDDDGRTRKLNVPARVLVRVHERKTMLCVWSGLSAADGTWRADFLSNHYRYVVMGFDDTGVVNAAIQDWITPHVEP